MKTHTQGFAKVLDNMLKLFLSCAALVLLANNASSQGRWREKRALSDNFQDLVNTGDIDAIPQALLPLYFGDEQAIQNGTYTTGEVRDPPTILFQFEENCFYICIVWWRNAPNRAEPLWGNFLQYLNPNINTDIAMSEPCPVRYYPPNPVAGTGLNEYYFCLFKQRDGLISVDLTPLEVDRQLFDVLEFIRQYNLELIAGTKINVEHPATC